MKLPLKKIQCDGGTQTRATIDDTIIEDYAQDMRQGAQFPPLIVFHDGRKYWLADGFHRFGAAMALHLDAIECEVRPGTLKDAQWYSFSANKTNGMRRTNEDKVRAVKAALRHNHCVSNHEIGRHVGVSDHTVGKYRAELEKAGEIQPLDHDSDSASTKSAKIEDGQADAGQSARVVTRKGKTYQMRTGKIGRFKTPRKKPAPKKTPFTPIRQPGQGIPMLAIQIPLNNPDAAGRTLVSNCEPQYLREMVKTILSLIEERNANEHAS